MSQAVAPAIGLSQRQGTACLGPAADEPSRPGADDDGTVAVYGTRNQEGPSLPEALHHFPARTGDADDQLHKP